MTGPDPLRRYAPAMDTSSQTRPAHPPGTTGSAVATRLAESVEVVTRGELAVEISGVSLSTDRIVPGDLYAALPGARTHGAEHVGRAEAAGAVAVLTDPQGLGKIPEHLPTIVVPHPRRVLGHVSAHVYGQPARDLRMIGVTGTQGKTTTTRLLEQGLNRADVPAAVVGTLGTRVAGQDIETVLTTPEAPDLHGLFAVMRERGVDTCAMEISSHALVLGRVDGVVFDVATFLNLGRDHLDFHRDLADYFDAKASLFTPERAHQGLTNVDDEHGRALLARSAIAMSTFSTTGRPADWQALDVDLSPAGASFTVRGPGVVVSAHVPVPGRFNVSNALAAIASAALAGLDPQVVADGIAAGGGVPGRLEPVRAGQDFTVLVDYAHKPDAVEAVLATLRPLTAGRVIVVIGAGGDRDRGKRPIMGELVGRLADLVVVTDDNPRTEEPGAIRAELLTGTRAGPAEVLEVGDRGQAISEALRRADTGDVVLIAGKGHEPGQEVAGVIHPFDDRVVAAEQLARLTGGAE